MTDGIAVCGLLLIGGLFVFGVAAIGFQFGFNTGWDRGKRSFKQAWKEACPDCEGPDVW